MPKTLRLALLAAAALPLAGCLAPMTGSPYPVTSAGPNPAPAPGYRVICKTGFGLSYEPFNTFVSGCVQVIVPVETVVIRARG